MSAAHIAALRTVAVLMLGLWASLLALPEMLAAVRPAFAALAVAYLVGVTRSPWMLAVAWLQGLCMDVLLAAPLGQHALAFTLLCFGLLRLGGLLRALPLWQAGLLALPLWLGFGFVLFWIDGSSQHAADPASRLFSTLSTALCWPLVEQLARLRVRRLMASAHD